jgi:hypothetical protein
MNSRTKIELYEYVRKICRSDLVIVRIDGESVTVLMANENAFSISVKENGNLSWRKVA